MNIVHVDASVSLHGYKAWRKALRALPVGTFICFTEGYVGIIKSYSVKPGQLFKIIKVQGSNTEQASMVYKLIACSIHGIEHRFTINFTVEHVARQLHKGGWHIMCQG